MSGSWRRNSGGSGTPDRLKLQGTGDEPQPGRHAHPGTDGAAAAIYLVAPYMDQYPDVKQPRMRAVKHVSGRLIRQGQMECSLLEYTEATLQRGIA